MKKQKTTRSPEEEKLYQGRIKLLKTVGYGLSIGTPIIAWFFFYESLGSNRIGILLAIFTALIVNGTIGLINTWFLSKDQEEALVKSIERVLDESFKEHFINETISESIKRGFEYCNYKVGELRVLAVSSSNIIPGMTEIQNEQKTKNIPIDRCRLMVRGYDAEQMAQGEKQANSIANENIRRWERLGIMDFDYVRYHNLPLDYYIIFDDKYITFGQYYVDKDDVHKVKFFNPFSITDRIGHKFISNFIHQFDFYYKSEEKKRVDCNKFAQKYNELRSVVPELVDRLIAECGLTHESNILDFGCGTGNYITAFKEKGYRNISGMDISEEMWKIAKNKTHKTIYGSISEIDDTFDFIFMVDVIHFVRDVDTLAKKLFYKLKPGGKIALVTKSQEQIETSPFNKYFPFLVDIQLTRYHPIDKLSEQFENAGFKFGSAIDFEENPPRILNNDLLEKVRQKCFSVFWLLPDEIFDNGIKEFERTLTDTENNEIEENDTGKTILVFSKQ